jgi:hypothetical protein
MQSFLIQKKTLIIEMLVLVVFLGGSYYAYVTFSADDVITTQPAINQSLLGQNFVLFLKAVQEDKLSFKDVKFADSKLVDQLEDYSETIGTTTARGRVDPFIPYASSRPLR